MRIGKIFILLLGFISAFSQKVTISEDINLRTDVLYDIMGKIDGKILLYRDKGTDHVIQIYDDNLWEKGTVELNFEKNRIDPVGLVPGEKDFCFFYTYRNKGEQVLAARKFDAAGVLLDTATLNVNNALLQFQKYYYTHSNDKNFVTVFNFIRDNSIQVHLFDRSKMKLVWEKTYVFDFSFIRKDFRDIIVTDNGGCFIIFERENLRLGKPEIYLEAYYLNPYDGQITKQNFAFGEKYIIDYEMTYDNVNSSLIIAGLFGDRLRSRADGYFFLNNGLFAFSYFKPELLAELEKNSKRRIAYLEDYEVVNLTLREDGGIILLTEMQRQLSRRTNIADGRRQAFSLNAYVDYYNEDMVLLSIHPDGREHWHQVLRKKQFSQDDGALYSSFFVFRSPTELRVVFNDEIKQDNTVSEYMVNPIGEFQRNIVMNTEYQKLKLRFPDAIQISTREFIVPSERNSKFNLVKVTY